MRTRRQVLSGLTVVSLGMVAGCMQEQAQAEQTGRKTSSEVSDVAQFGKVVGKVNSENTKINTLNASLKLGAGSEPINLSEVTFSIRLPDTAAVIEDTARQTSGLKFHQVQGLENGSTTLRDQQDLIVVTFELSKIDSVKPIKPDTPVVLISDGKNIDQSVVQLRTPTKKIMDKSEGKSYIL